MRFRLLITTIIILFCAIGCLLQILLVSSEYLRFRVTSKVDFSFQKRIELPDFTICTEFIQAINWTYFHNNHLNLTINLNCTLTGSLDDRINKLRSCFHSKLTSVQFRNLISQQFTINQFYKNIISDDQLFTSVIIFSSVGYYDALAKNNQRRANCYSETFIKDPLVCYHIGCRDRFNSNSPIVVDKNEIYSPVANTLYHVGFNQSIISQWKDGFLFLHPAAFLPYGLTSRSQLINLSKSSEAYYLTFKRIQLRYLPPPYETNCKVYRDIDQGIESAAHLLEMCINNQTIKLDNFILPHSIIRNPGEVKYKFENKGKHNYSTELQQIFVDCNKLITQPECIKNYYIPAMKGVEKFGPAIRVSYVLVIAPIEPNIRKISFPKWSSVDYFVYIGSTLSLWFGFYISGHLRRLVNNPTINGLNSCNCRHRSNRLSVQDQFRH